MRGEDYMNMITEDVKQKKYTILFRYNKYRRDKHKKSNFDGRIRPYWKKQYYDLFRNWH